jgi:hypothetical protein
MPKKAQKLRVMISTAMTAQNPVEVEVEGAELELLGAMSIEDALKYLLAKRADHLTARHVQEAIQHPYAYIEINGQPAPMQSERLGRFIEPERDPMSNEGIQGPPVVVKTLTVMASSQESGGG